MLFPRDKPRKKHWYKIFEKIIKEFAYLFNCDFKVFINRCLAIIKFKFFRT
jgi:hypothetical protein